MTTVLPSDLLRAPQQQHTEPTSRSIRDVAVIGTDHPGSEPMTDTERQQWAALEQSFLTGLAQTRANAYARRAARTTAVSA